MKLLTPKVYSKGSTNKQLLKYKIDSVNVPIAYNEQVSDQTIQSDTFRTVNIQGDPVSLSDLRNNIKNLRKIGNVINDNAADFRQIVYLLEKQHGGYVISTDYTYPSSTMQGVAAIVLGDIDVEYELSSPIDISQPLTVETSCTSETDEVTDISQTGFSPSISIGNINGSINSVIDNINTYKNSMVSNSPRYLNTLDQSDETMPVMPFVRKAKIYNGFNWDNPVVSDPTEIITKWNNSFRANDPEDVAGAFNYMISFVGCLYKSNVLQKYNNAEYYDSVINDAAFLPSTIAYKDIVNSGYWGSHAYSIDLRKTIQIQDSSGWKNAEDNIQYYECLKAKSLGVRYKLKADAIDQSTIRLHGTFPIAFVYYASGLESHAFIDYVTSINVDIKASVIDRKKVENTIFVAPDNYYYGYSPVYHNDENKYNLYTGAEASLQPKTYLYSFPDSGLLTSSAYYIAHYDFDPTPAQIPWTQVVASSILYKYAYGKSVFKCTVSAKWFLDQKLQLNDRLFIVGLNNNAIKKDRIPILYQLKNVEARYDQNEFVYELSFLESFPNTYLYFKFSDNTSGYLDVTYFGKDLIPPDCIISPSTLESLLVDVLGKSPDDIIEMILVGNSFKYSSFMPATLNIIIQSFPNLRNIDLHNYIPYNPSETLTLQFPFEKVTGEIVKGTVDFDTWDNTLDWSMENETLPGQSLTSVYEIDFFANWRTDFSNDYLFKNSNNETIVKIKNFYYNGTIESFENKTFGTNSNPRDVCDKMYVWENGGWRLLPTPQPVFDHFHLYYGENNTFRSVPHTAQLGVTYNVKRIHFEILNPTRVTAAGVTFKQDGNVILSNLNVSTHQVDISPQINITSDTVFTLSCMDILGNEIVASYPVHFTNYIRVKATTSETAPTYNLIRKDVTVDSNDSFEVSYNTGDYIYFYHTSNDRTLQYYDSNSNTWYNVPNVTVSTNTVAIDVDISVTQNYYIYKAGPFTTGDPTTFRMYG